MDSELYVFILRLYFIQYSAFAFKIIWYYGFIKPLIIFCSIGVSCADSYCKLVFIVEKMCTKVKVLATIMNFTNKSILATFVSFHCEFR